MSAYVTPAIALVAAIAAVASLLIAVHSSRRSDRDSARDEALALAEVRGQMLRDLRADYERRTRALEAALAELRRILDRELAETPPNVERALARLRQSLRPTERPPAVR